jgi:hypothetical protein
MRRRDMRCSLSRDAGSLVLGLLLNGCFLLNVLIPTLLPLVRNAPSA